MAERLDTEGARIAAALGVIMEWEGLTACEAREWLEDESRVSGIPFLEAADLVVLEAAWKELF